VRAACRPLPSCGGRQAALGRITDLWAGTARPCVTDCAYLPPRDPQRRANRYATGPSATPDTSTKGAALRQHGLVVNHKKIRRLMREHCSADSQALHRHDRQRSRGSDLPRIWRRILSQPALTCSGSVTITSIAVTAPFRLRCHHSRCLVTSDRRLPYRSVDRRAPDGGGLEGGHRQGKAASTIPTGGFEPKHPTVRRVRVAERDPLIKKDTLDQLLDGCDSQAVSSKDGLFNELKKALAERV
jgi:hypothetical protein